MVDPEQGRRHFVGDPKPPATRAGCEGGMAERRSGEVTCPYLTCRYNILGMLSKRPDAEFERSLAARIEGLWRDSCVLDMVDGGADVDDDMIAIIMGITKKRVTQYGAESLVRFKRAFKHWDDED